MRTSTDQDTLRAGWKAMVAGYQSPDLRRSLWMLANSLLPFFMLWAVMAWSLRLSYFLTLLLAIPTAGFLVRIFIIFHDCGHGSYFKSQQLNAWVGRVTGLLTFTPYYSWTREHAIHHATAGDLDRRGVGDVDTLTVDEFLALPPLRRLGYRLMRSGWLLFTVGAPFMFIVLHRFPLRKGLGPKEQRSIWTTNLALLALFGGLSWLLGWRTVLLVELPVIWLAALVGVWMFYVQHQFDGVYWRRHTEWDYLSSAIQGASYYQLPRLLQWFSGSIGFHHIHHLAPRIPNYLLEQCFRDNPALQIRPLTLPASLRCLQMNLYDEARDCMVSFGELKRRPTPAD